MLIREMSVTVASAKKVTRVLKGWECLTLGANIRVLLARSSGTIPGMLRIYAREREQWIIFGAIIGASHPGCAASPSATHEHF
jgi:hypothetical protein